MKKYQRNIGYEAEVAPFDPYVIMYMLFSLGPLQAF